MHDMNSLDFITRFKECKGATSFAVDKNYTSRRIAIAIKKKITLFRYSDVDYKQYQVQ